MDSARGSSAYMYHPLFRPTSTFSQGFTSKRADGGKISMRNFYRGLKSFKVAMEKSAIQRRYSNNSSEEQRLGADMRLAGGNSQADEGSPTGGVYFFDSVTDVWCKTKRPKQKREVQGTEYWIQDKESSKDGSSTFTLHAGGLSANREVLYLLIHQPLLRELAAYLNIAAEDYPQAGEYSNPSFKEKLERQTFINEEQAIFNLLQSVFRAMDNELLPEDVPPGKESHYRSKASRLSSLLSRAAGVAGKTDSNGCFECEIDLKENLPGIRSLPLSWRGVFCAGPEVVAG